MSTTEDPTTAGAAGAAGADGEADVTGRLRAFLDGSRAWARDRIRDEVLSDPMFAPVTTDLSDAEHRERVLEQVRHLCGMEDGSAYGFPESVGGKNDIGSYVTVFETMGMGDLSLLVKLGVQFGLFGGAIQHLGSERHHAEYLPGVISGELLGAYAMTETGHGSNVQQLETTATYDIRTDEFVIDTPSRSAWKDYGGNSGQHATHCVVFARLVTKGHDHGVHAFVVPIRAEVGGDPLPGITAEDDGHKAGLNGVDNGRLAFDGVRIPRANLLDRYASVDPADGSYSSPIDSDSARFWTMLGTLIQGRISVAGGAIGATKRALAITVRYAEQRRQFPGSDEDEEVTLLDYLTYQRRVLPRLAATYALQLAQTANVDELHRIFSEDRTDGRRELESAAAGLKAVATWHATDTIQACREACGGAGYLAENLLPQLKADTDVFTTFEGDNTVLLQLVAKEQLTGFQADLGHDVVGTARFFTDLVGDLVTERTSARRVGQALADVVRTERWSASSLVELLEFRERHAMEGVARRLAVDVGLRRRDQWRSFNAAQDHVVAVGRAHVERLVLERFAAAVDEVEAGPAREVLDLLVELHGLATVEADRAWFMEHGRLSASRSKMITARVNELCGLLRPHARTLVDAFGVPELQLSAPIAQPGAGYGAA